MKSKVSKISVIVVLVLGLLFAAGLSAMAYDITWSSDYQFGNRITVYFRSSSYNQPYIYCYADSYEVSSWPGNPMSPGADGWYTYTIKDLRQARVIFSNNGSNQNLAAGQDGFLVSGDKWYCDGNWFDSKPSSTIVHYFNDQNWNNVNLYYYQNGLNSPSWPGVSMQNEDYGWYTYEITGFTSPKVIFSTNGNSQIPGQGQEGFEVSGEKWYKNGQWYNSDPTVYKDIVVHYYNSNNWDNVSLYYYDTQTGSQQWPGVSMNSEGDGWYSYEIECIDDPRVIFSNNGSSQIPQQEGYSVSNESWFRNGTWTSVRPTDVTVYFKKPNNWNSPNVYYYISNSDTGPSWPGSSMEEITGGWYKYTITKYSDAKVIFNDGTNQMPSANMPGFDVSGAMWYDDGIWYRYNPDTLTTNTMTGDLNGDGVIDENDYALLEDYINDGQNNDLTDEQLLLADTNGDGIVDEDDMALIEQMINGEIEEFPVDRTLTDREISYEYDKLGRVTRAIYSEDYYIEYIYDANGNITSVDVHETSEE